MCIDIFFGSCSEERTAVRKNVSWFHNTIINYTPIPYLIKFPIDIAMAIDINLNQWIIMILIGLLWCFVMRGLGGGLYTIGIRRYEAYGS